jgi:hypothetical protein
MKVTFYGTRGSIPVPEKEMIQIGGNTSCVLVKFDNDQIVILDSGTGIRKLGNEMISKVLNNLQTFTSHYLIRILIISTGFHFSNPHMTPGDISLYHCAGKKEWEMNSEIFFQDRCVGTIFLYR